MGRIRVSAGVALLMVGAAVALPAVFSQSWQEFKGDHFIVYFEGRDKFPRKVLRRAEGYYKKIAHDLGYQRYSKFWTWDNRVKIYIYPDRTSFLKATNQPPWSMGMADYTNKHLTSFQGSPQFLDRILPHEIAHLIFRDYVGFKGQVPLWLDEGVAMWQEEGKREEARLRVKELLARNMLLDIKTLTTLDIRTSTDTQLVGIFYLEAISLVEFLIRRYGADDFINFCRQLRDGKDLNEALRFSYPTTISNLDKLERAWIEYISGE